MSVWNEGDLDEDEAADATRVDGTLDELLVAPLEPLGDVRISLPRRTAGDVGSLMDAFRTGRYR